MEAMAASHRSRLSNTGSGTSIDDRTWQDLDLDAVFATVDRTEFGLNWNMPLPTGDQALANTVTILTELQLVKAA